MNGIKSFGFVIMASISYFSYAQASDISLQEEQVASINESVTVTVRCPGGGKAVGGEYSATNANVSLAEEEGVDCVTGGCTAWQMRFVSDSPEPFNVTAQAQCQGVDPAKIPPYGDRKAMKAFRKANPEMFTTVE